MYFRDWAALKQLCPVENGVWNREVLAEYLIQSCSSRFTEQIDTFMVNYQKDEALAEVLFELLLDEDRDGSDSQMGAAKYIARMDRNILRQKKDLLLRAQKREVVWKRPFPCDEHLIWL